MDSQIVENKWFGCKVNNEIYNRTKFIETCFEAT